MNKQKGKMWNSKNVAVSIVAIFMLGIMFVVPNKNVELVVQDNGQEIEMKDSGNLEVQFIDVGQADCILVRNNNNNMLIDAGNNKDGEKLVKYFKSLGIEKFDILVGTHPHEDHIGGLDNIIYNFEIGKIYMPNVLTTTRHI